MVRWGSERFLELLRKSIIRESAPFSSGPLVYFAHRAGFFLPACDWPHTSTFWKLASFGDIGDFTKTSFSTKTYHLAAHAEQNQLHPDQPFL